jgi:cysteine-rich repeat protein
VCQPLHAASDCSSAKEHLSFLAPSDGRYYIGVDSVEPGGGLVEVLAVIPECGDGEKQHSEPCEDGNLTSGDGCDDYCRFELDASDRPELEPNDDLSSGNALRVTEATFRVRGRNEGPCDPEVFSFDLPEARRASFRVVDGVHGGCITPGAGVALQLTLHRGLFELARATPDAMGCLALTGIDLQARDEAGAAPAADATYHVQLRALPVDEMVPVDYALELELE